MATASAKSSMSIFSSCEAAPYSGVITYRATSATLVIAASPWPMPGVSTITRSAPAARQASTSSGMHAGSSVSAERDASERNVTCDEPMAFMRMRSPRSAPPERRRVGSTASTAMRSASSWSSRNRSTSSSVSDDLPDPPEPVIPSTGTGRPAAADRSALTSSSGRIPSSIAVSVLARPRDEPARRSCRSSGGAVARSFSAMITFTIAARPSRCPSAGEKMRTPERASRSISSETITPPPPP